MDVIVNDTNIFIDLHSIGLLRSLCELPYDVRTVDFVVAEIIEPSQNKAISELISEGKIKVENFDSEELPEIIAEHNSAPGNLSIQDCSVCFYARKHSATLVTGDRQLRKYAEAENVKVKGILFVFDEMVNHNVLMPQLAATKLKTLLGVNIRLPKAEVEKRIRLWQGIA